MDLYCCLPSKTWLLSSNQPNFHTVSTALLSQLVIITFLWGLFIGVGGLEALNSPIGVNEKTGTSWALRYLKQHFSMESLRSLKCMLPVNTHKCQCFIVLMLRHRGILIFCLSYRPLWKYWNIATIFIILELLLKAYTSITSWWLLFKSVVVVYREETMTNASLFQYFN